MESKVKVICAEKKFAKNINSSLKQENKIDTKYRITNKNSDFLYLPVLNTLSGILSFVNFFFYFFCYYLAKKK